MKNEKLIYCGLILGFLAAASALCMLNAKAIAMATSGKGHEVYLTFHLTPISYNGFLILEVTILLALLFAGGLWLRERLLERSLLKKYPKRQGKPQEGRHENQ